MNYTVKLSLVVLIGYQLTQAVYAGGFGVAEQSGSGLGNAYAGGAVSTEDAATVWFNPAGMSELSPQQKHLSGALNFVDPRLSFTNVDSFINPALTGNNLTAAKAALKGKDDTSKELAGVPNFYYVKPLNQRLSAGVAVNAPFGSEVIYDKDWYGRYNALETSLKTINVNPALSYRVNDRLSVGGGLDVQYTQVKLSSALDSPATCLGYSASNPTLRAKCVTAYPGVASAATLSSTLGNASTDSKATIAGDGVAYGYNLGVLYKPSPKTRLGAHYRSSVKYDVDGTVKYDLNAPLATALDGTGLLQNEDVKASIEMPDSLSLSVGHQFNQRWEVLADVTRVNWSKFKELKVTSASSGDTVSRVDESWKDTDRWSVGTNYQYNPKLKLRAGLALEKTPIPDATHRTPRIPDGDRQWLSIGANYRMNKNMSVDAGYTRLFFDQLAIDSTDEKSGYSTRGYFNNKTDILSVQLNWSY